MVRLFAPFRTSVEERRAGHHDKGAALAVIMSLQAVPGARR
jgi:hypothetical protein